MVRLTAHQEEAIDAYEALMAKYPVLFSGRQARPIVRERDVLAAYAAEHGTVLGVAAETPHVLFLVDLVQSRKPGGTARRHPYMRVVSRTQLEGGTSVVVLATIENPSLGDKGSIVLVEQERHALGDIEIELPRGFGESGVSGEEKALRELLEETGYVGDHARFLGTTCSDSGLTDASVSYYHVPVVRRTEPRPEMEEAIIGTRLATPEEMWSAFRSGDIRDGFTLQALALYERLRV